MRGRLITIEGLDGAGKTTLARGPRRRARASAGSTSSCCASPAASPLAERLRDARQGPGARVGARAEALVYAAARAQLVQEALLPLLAAGDAGCCSTASSTPRSPTRAPAAGSASRRSPSSTASRPPGSSPDRTLLLRIDPRAGRARQAGRGEAPDRLEREGEDFFARIALAYDELAAAEPERIRVLDAAQRPERCSPRRSARSRPAALSRHHVRARAQRPLACGRMRRLRVLG